jgi:hypothetical protein
MKLSKLEFELLSSSECLLGVLDNCPGSFNYGAELETNLRIIVSKTRAKLDEETINRLNKITFQKTKSLFRPWKG